MCLHVLDGNHAPCDAIHLGHHGLHVPPCALGGLLDPRLVVTLGVAQPRVIDRTKKENLREHVLDPMTLWCVEAICDILTARPWRVLDMAEPAVVPASQMQTNLIMNSDKLLQE